VALHYFFGVLGFVGAAVITLVLIALSSPSRAAAAASATTAQAAASRRVPLPRRVAARADRARTREPPFALWCLCV
jgi:hypothetical protein